MIGTPYGLVSLSDAVVVLEQVALHAPLLHVPVAHAAQAAPAVPQELVDSDARCV